MPAPISIIIPTLNASGPLPRLLQTAVPGLSAGLIREVIVSDGGSSDATQEIAEAAGARVVDGAASRGGQLRRGCAASRGDWLLVLHADSELPLDWPEIVSHALADSDQAYAFHLAFRATGLAPCLVAGWANLRSRAFGLPYGDQGLLISRALYDRVGGYRDQALMEDVAIALALRGHLHLLQGVLTTSADRYQREGWARRGARNLLLLGRYLLGAPPERLARRYDVASRSNCNRYSSE